jgi:transglutaminase-like putative cysteine protease
MLAACLAWTATADYLDEDLRARVAALKADVAQTPSNRANAQIRAATLMDWVNAYSLSGRYVPVNATSTASGVLAYPARANRIAGLDAAARKNLP